MTAGLIVSAGAPTLRVVHVITTLTTGGAERQVEALATASRHDVRVVSLYSGGVVADALRGRGVPVDVLGMAGWRKLVAPLRLARLLRRLRPDIVHVHLLSAQLWGIPAARLARVPVIVSTEHSIMETTIEGRPKTAWLRVLYRLLDRLATHTIAVSEATRERLAAWGVQDARRISVVNPPIDFAAMAQPGADDRAEVRAELGIDAGALVIGSVGRLDPVKRFDQLLTAVVDLLRGGAHLVIVGDGPLRPDLLDRAAELGVSAAVHLTGPRADVPRLLDAMDLFVSPSRDETFGMAVVEALAAGLPVVYAQCPALDGVPIDGGRAVRIARDTDPAAEQADLCAAAEALVGAGTERAPVPEGLVERYGVAGTAATVDALYDRLARHGR